ncbi:hypothetical protein [Halarsenatibacter silvermanii]|uniref:Uncharacterized protein n=1 Tax=Halarsenatibacter silvermanii TaxID=321763 RepID=A0A1G9U9L9_9FIRM|nr:hypothetical protein [Halarsenatibacter silvermanii]SDM56588.1 hypothetical protein SAMN04488692_1662 [Halarsenatibacter silvermanii]
MNNLNNKNGYALVIVILLITLFTILGVGFGNRFLSEVRTTTSNLDRRQAYLHAVAGAEYDGDEKCIEFKYNDSVEQYTYEEKNDCNNNLNQDELKYELTDDPKQAVIYINEGDSTSTAYLGDEDDYIDITVNLDGPPYRIER